MPDFTELQGSAVDALSLHVYLLHCDPLYTFVRFHRSAYSPKSFERVLLPEQRLCIRCFAQVGSYWRRAVLVGDRLHPDVIADLEEDSRIGEFVVTKFEPMGADECCPRCASLPPSTPPES